MPKKVQREIFLLTEPLFRRFGGSENFAPLPPSRVNGEKYNDIEHIKNKWLQCFRIHICQRVQELYMVARVAIIIKPYQHYIFTLCRQPMST